MTLRDFIYRFRTLIKVLSIHSALFSRFSFILCLLILSRLITKLYQYSSASFRLLKSCNNLFISQPVISPFISVMISFIPCHSRTMSSWFNDVRFSVFITQDSEGSNFNVVNVKSIIDPSFLPDLVIAPDSLLRIRS